jgi:hypothetical protein
MNPEERRECLLRQPLHFGVLVDKDEEHQQSEHVALMTIDFRLDRA